MNLRIKLCMIQFMSSHTGGEILLLSVIPSIHLLVCTAVVDHS
jgi:hypothetical protein